jgi:hypothetical protein
MASNINISLAHVVETTWLTPHYTVSSNHNKLSLAKMHNHTKLVLPILISTGHGNNYTSRAVACTLEYGFEYREKR